MKNTLGFMILTLRHLKENKFNLISLLLNILTITQVWECFYVAMSVFLSMLLSYVTLSTQVFKEMVRKGILWQIGFRSRTPVSVEF